MTFYSHWSSPYTSIFSEDLFIYLFILAILFIWFAFFLKNLETKRGKPELVWTCAKEGQWKDVEYGASRRKSGILRG